MASGLVHSQPERCEMSLLERIKALEDTNAQIRQERDKISSELQCSLSENMKLQERLINLQQVITNLQPDIIMARIEKTLKLVEFMDLEGKSQQDLFSARQSLDGESSDEENELNPLDIVKAELYLKIEVEDDEANACEDEPQTNSAKSVPNSQMEGGLADIAREWIEKEEIPASLNIDGGHERGSDCLVCDYEYADPDDYNTHLETVHGLKHKRFECFHCGQILQKISALERHISKLHDGVPKPGATWTSIKSDESQEKTAKPKQKVPERTIRKRCVLCGFLATRTEMVGHCQAVHGFTNNNCPCDKCPYVAKSIENLKRHVRTTHTAKRKQCKECGKEFPFSTKLSQHMNIVHRQIKFKCEFCDHVTNRADNLRQHVDAKHKGVMYFCDKCTFSSNYSNSLAYHMRTQHDLPESEGSVKVTVKTARSSAATERNYHCDQCVFSARNNAILQEHILVKHKGKRFQCDQCTYSSTTKYDLRKHTAVAHQGLPLKVHSCEFCDTKFLQVGTFLKHQKQRLENLSAKQYKCDICDMVFCFLNGLKKHKRHVHHS